MKWPKGAAGHAMAGVPFFLAAAAAPVLGETWTTILTLAFLFVLLSQAWNLVGGIAGQFSLGHSLFFAAGAYTSTLLFRHFGLSPWIGMLAGGAVAAAMGAAMAWVSFRYALPPLSFALVTLALAMLGYLLLSTVDYVGASRGLTLPMRGDWTTMHFRSDSAYYYVVLALAATAFAFTSLIYERRLGIYLRCIRDNERAARAIGIDVLRYKIVAMMVSGALTAFGGTFFAQYLQYIDPRTFGGIEIVIQIILFTGVGGSGTIWGPVLGPLLLIPASELLRSALAGQFNGLSLMIYGVVLVAAIRFMPGGIMAAAARLARPRSTLNSGVER